MSKPSAPFDPEVLALLKEIVEDPESTLLRVPEAHLSKWLTAREPPVSPREPLLTRAERHLLHVHRECAARLLLERCVMDLTKGPIRETKIHRQITPDTQLALPPEEHWLGRAHAALDDGARASIWGGELEVLGSRVKGESLAFPSDLAAASLRLNPSDQARVWVGVALQRVRQERSAWRILTSVLAHSPCGADEAWARADLGFVRFWQEDYAAAVDWYESAARVRTDTLYPAFAMDWMTSALQVGDVAAARNAARFLAERVEADDPVLAEFISSLQAVITTANCKRILPRVRDKVPPVARGIADALLPHSFS